MSETPVKDSVKPVSMPEKVRAVHVASLIDEIGELGDGVHITRMVEETGLDSGVLVRVIKAAEILELVRNEGGGLFLTEDGLKFRGSTMVRIPLLRDRLAAIEPFHTAIELASERGSTTAKDVANTLMDRGIQWHYKPELNEARVRMLLIHWTIRAGLLTYDGKTRKFQNLRST
jgi:hypothetical protein